jgi:hypothetical protein
MARRCHGGRRARVRGRAKIAADFALLAAAVNLARLARLGLTIGNGRWIVASTWAAASNTDRRIPRPAAGDRASHERALTGWGSSIGCEPESQS